MDSLTGIGFAPAASAPPEIKPKNIKDAAAQFEAMLLQQMLKSTRESMSSEPGDSGSDSMREYAEENLAQMLAQGGGLGIGQMIARNLERQSGKPAGANR